MPQVTQRCTEGTEFHRERGEEKPNGLGKTFAEISSEERAAVSMHRQEIERFRAYLERQDK
jgi:inosine/xanthosine triphosphate pyrophosphatase family protein